MRPTKLSLALLRSVPTRIASVGTLAGVITAALGAGFVACVGDDPAASETPTTDAATDGSATQEPTADTGAPSSDATTLPDASEPGDADAAPGRIAVPQVTAGHDHACALTAQGDVYCWGRGQLGELGIDPTALTESCGGTPCSSTPRKVEGLPPIIRLARGNGGSWSCAIDDAGAVWCWGRNEQYQLGRVTTHACAQGATTVGCDPVPGKVPNIPPAVEVVGGYTSHTCARSGTGAVNCWGSNADGQLGRAASATPSLPGAVVETLGADVKQVAAGYSDTGFVAAVQAGKALTWGGYYVGNLGRDIPGAPLCGGTLYCASVPGAVRAGSLDGGALGNVLDVRAGLSTGYALVSGGKVVAWGNGEQGQLGDESGLAGEGAGHARAYAVEIAGVTDVKAIDARYRTACLSHGDDLQCWGSNEVGQLGQSNLDSVACAGGAAACAGKPLAVALPAKVKSFAVGSRSTYALLEDGRLMAWGDNTVGQLGHAPGGADVVVSGRYVSSTPVEAPGLPLLK